MGFSFKAVPVTLGIVLGFVIAGGVGLEIIKNSKERIWVKVGNGVVLADVARTEEERARGLSGRDYLEERKGMLFLFDSSGRHGFWMRRMSFPIDIVWIGEEEVTGIKRVVGFEENVTPPPKNTNDNGGSLKVYYPPEPVRTVLEISAGEVRSFNLRVGDAVELEPLVSVGTRGERE